MIEWAATVWAFSKLESIVFMVRFHEIISISFSGWRGSAGNLHIVVLKMANNLRIQGLARSCEVRQNMKTGAWDPPSLRQVTPCTVCMYRVRVKNSHKAYEPRHWLTVGGRCEINDLHASEMLRLCEGSGSSKLLPFVTHHTWPWLVSGVQFWSYTFLEI